MVSADGLTRASECHHRHHHYYHHHAIASSLPQVSANCLSSFVDWQLEEIVCEDGSKRHIRVKNGGTVMECPDGRLPTLIDIMCTPPADPDPVFEPNRSFSFTRLSVLSSDTGTFVQVSASGDVVEHMPDGAKPRAPGGVRGGRGSSAASSCMHMNVMLTFYILEC